MKVAIIDKCPNKVNYEKLFGFPVEVLHLADKKVQRLKKADITLELNPHDYDWIILVGSEALKQYTRHTRVTDYSGKQVESKDGSYKNFLVSSNPAMLFIKPETKPAFDATVAEIRSIMDGTKEAKAEVDYAPIQSTEGILEYLNLVYMLPVAQVPVIALDTETTGLAARKCQPLGISMSHRTHQGVYMDADYFDDECAELLQKIIDTPKRNVVLHNSKFDDHIMTYHFGTDFEKAHQEGRLHDTMVMHYVLDERQGTHGLKSLAMKYTDMGDYDFALDEFKKNYCKEHKIKQEEFTYDLIPFDIMWQYAAGDTDATIRLYHKFWNILCRDTSFKLKWLYENLLMPATRFLGRMEERGIPLSRKRLYRAHEHLELQLRELQEKLYEYPEVKECEALLDKQFNPNSTQQLRTLLFDVVGLSPTGKMTDSGADSTDAEVLEKLGEQHPIPKLILDIRKTSKLINSFIIKLLDNIDADGRIRTNFLCTSTTSGRLSSSGTFNAQQLPRDNPIIKGCIVAPAGYKVVAKDLTTAEVYYAAVLSGDRNLQQVFINMTNEPDKYADFHSTIAHMVFNLPCKPNEVKKKFPAMRQAAKAITFGIMYGSGPAKVAESVNIALLEQSLETGEPFVPCTIEDAKGHIDTYFRKFPQLRRWINSSHEQIRQYGFIYNFYGRKRRLRNFQSTDRGVVAGEVRSGFNAIIQSASSDSLLVGVMEADKEIMAKGMDAEIIGLVHDSIIAIVREDLVDEYNEIIDRNVQDLRYNGWDDEPLTIKGCPIGIDSDSEDGGSRDYSCGKMDKAYPFISVYDSPEMQAKAVEVFEKIKEGWTPEKDDKGKYVNPKEGAIYDYREWVLESLQDIGIAA
ncbi:DNA polymerase I [Vibrio phage VPG01]|nr:DNA polymerase I [Vibrio phage VPG01]